MAVPRFHAEYIIDSEGRRKAVILPVEEYEELLQVLIVRVRHRKEVHR